MSIEPHKNDSLLRIGQFYDSVYYRNARADTNVSRHLRSLVSRLAIRKGDRVLDVGCGTGQWLIAVRKCGAYPYGVDLSSKAISICKTIIPDGVFHAGPAETLPFENETFDVVSCLGSLEHFVDPVLALKEMARVAKKDATFLILVPNAGFLTRRLGLYGGTNQVDAKEDVRSIQEWRALFEMAGLEVKRMWKDLHVLSWHWILTGRWYAVPVRAVQALALSTWPLKWQYQIYFRCSKR